MRERLNKPYINLGLKRTGFTQFHPRETQRRHSSLKDTHGYPPNGATHFLVRHLRSVVLLCAPHRSGHLRLADAEYAVLLILPLDHGAAIARVVQYVSNKLPQVVNFGHWSRKVNECL